MKFKLDGRIYNLDLTRTIEFERAVYQAANENGIVTPDGKVHKLGSGLLRSAIGMVMTPIVIPLIHKMYATHNIVLEPPEKHCDLIDYAVNAFLDYALIIQGKFYADFTSEACGNSESTIVAVTPSFLDQNEKQQLAIDSPSHEPDRENE